MKLLKTLMCAIYDMTDEDWKLFLQRENNLDEWYEILKLKLDKEQKARGIKDV